MVNKYSDKKRVIKSFFKNEQDLSQCLSKVLKVLTGPNDLIKSSDDSISVLDLIGEVKTEVPSLSYINTNHISECFLKDHTNKIFYVSEDRIKLRVIKFVKPPEVLYFGTLEHLVESMRINGLKSTTKFYIKLFSSQTESEEFCSKFVQKPTDKVTTLKIDAWKAFEEGIRFSTYKEGLFIVTSLDPKYIKAE